MLREADASVARSQSGPDNGDAARWIRIAQALLLPPTGSKRLELSPNRKAPGDEGSPAFVQILECPTGRTALILWRDPGRCYYADQLWVRGTAGYGGRCALSGQSIKSGESIYRPRQGKPRTLNAFAMILTSVIEVEGSL